MSGYIIEKSEVARAFGKSSEEFDEIFPSLRVLGFPKPIADGEAWHIAELLDWVTKHQEMTLSFVAHISQWLE
jgi:hypothetical protein